MRPACGGESHVSGPASPTANFKRVSANTEAGGGDRNLGLLGILKPGAGYDTRAARLSI